MIHFIKDNNIDKYIKFKIQNGGSNYLTVIDNIELKFNYFMNEFDDNTIIYITEVNDTSSLKYCAMLSYSNRDILNIGLIETPKKCLDIKLLDISDSKDIIKSKLKYGTIFIKAIIAFARDNGFKKIHLDDISRFNCLDIYSKLSYSLLYVHILTDGETWYESFGFKFIEKRDMLKSEKNRANIINKLTKDLSFDRLLFMIYTKYSDITKELIYSILKLYIKYKYSKLCEFLKEFTRLYCHIMSLIYMEIYNYLKLEIFETNRMEYNI